MPSITATGLGSGLDIENIVTSLMQLERRPLTNLQDDQKDVDARISAYGDLKSSLSSFQDAMTKLKSVDAFEVYTVSTSQASTEDYFSASADASAVPGSYSIDFSDPSHHLATADKENSTLVIADSATSTAAAGTMRIALTGTPATYLEVNVDGSNDTLAGIRDAINAASAASTTMDVTATIINVDTGSRLVITADDTGLDSAITISDTSGNVASTLNFSTVTAAQNAVFSIDGNTVTSQSNVIEDAIEGVNITLKEKSLNAETLTVANDTDAVKENVQSFVDAYNTVVDKIKGLRSGKLAGENFLLTLDQQIRNVINTPPTGLSTSLQYLSEIGISTDSKGKFTLDSSKLETQLATDFDSVSDLLANNAQGYIYRLDDYVDGVLSLDGLIATRTDTLSDQKDRLGDDILNMEYRLEQIEKRFRSQFTSLDSLLSGLNATSNYLSQQLTNLPGAAS